MKRVKRGDKLLRIRRLLIRRRGYEDVSLNLWITFPQRRGDVYEGLARAGKPIGREYLCVGADPFSCLEAQIETLKVYVETCLPKGTLLFELDGTKFVDPRPSISSVSARKPPA